MNLTKRCLVILIFALFISSLTLAVVPQSYYFYVNDTANVLSQTLEDYIINTNAELNQQTGAQVVVVTVDSLEGQSIEDYSTELFRQYGIGDKNKNNGVLLIVSIGDRDVRIEVGYGLEGRLNDGKCGRILDTYVVPYFKDNNWEKGIEEGFNAILSEVSEEYGISLKKIDKNFTYDSKAMEDSLEPTSVFIGMFVSIIASLIISLTGIKWYISLLVKMLFAFVLSLIIYLIENAIFSSGLDFATILVLNLIGIFIGWVSSLSNGHSGYYGGRWWRWRLLWRRWIFWRWRFKPFILKHNSIFGNTKNGDFFDFSTEVKSIFYSKIHMNNIFVDLYAIIDIIISIIYQRSVYYDY